VYDGTLNGAPILIKVISFNTADAEMDLVTEKDAHNEINITQLLKNKVGACDDDSELICFLGYACNTYYNKDNILSEPIQRRSDIPIKSLWLLYKKIDGPDFFSNYTSYVKEREFLTIIKIFTNILRGIKKIHDLDIVHLDIKPENIMIKKINYKPVIIDFGFACSVKEGDTQYRCKIPFMKGTYDYAAPEILYGETATAFRSLQDIKKVDIYALGVMIFEIFTRQKLYATDERAQEYNGTYSRENFLGSNKFGKPAFTLRLKGPSLLSNIQLPRIGSTRNRINMESITNLIEKMLHLNIAKRPTIDQVLGEWKEITGDVSIEGPKIRIAFVRHAISCSNAIRMKHHRFDSGYNNLSQKIKDSPLSDLGKELAEKYSPSIKKDLKTLGFGSGTNLASSSLLRARQTLNLLFYPTTCIILPYLKEQGDHLENTPNDIETQNKIVGACTNMIDARISAPVSSASSASSSNQISQIEDGGDWNKFCIWLRDNIANRKVFQRTETGHLMLVIVGHGSYLSNVYASLTQQRSRDVRMENMDWFAVESDIIDGTPFVFKPITGIMKAPAVTDDMILKNRCTIRDTPYRPFTIAEDSNIFQWKAQLDQLYVDYLSSIPIPPTLPLGMIIEALGNSFTLYDDLEKYNKDITVRTIFIKLYDCVKRMKQWPPTGYNGPPTYLIEGYQLETSEHYYLRILSSIGQRTGISQKDVYERIKTADNKEYIINDLLGLPLTTTSLPDSISRAGNLEGNIILYNKENAYSRVLLPFNASTSYDHFLLLIKRESTTTEYQDVFYAMDANLSLLDKQLSDYNAQFFTVIDTTKNIDQPIQGHIYIVNIKDNKKIVADFFTTAQGEQAENNNELNLKMPPKKLVKNTTYLQFNYIFMRDRHQSGPVGIIQGFKLYEYPDIAAALFMGGEINMSDHAQKLLGAAWATAEKRRAWILQKTDLTEDAFRARYEPFLARFREGSVISRTKAISEVREVTSGDKLYLNALELMSKFSPREACAKILDDSDDLSGRLKLALGSLLSPGFLRNTCPSTEQLMSVIERERGRPKFEEMDFVAYIVALRDITATKYVKSKKLYDEFRRWLISYNNTKRTRDTSLFIPEIIEIGDKVADPEIRSTPITVGYWRKDFVKSLTAIVELLKGQGEGRLLDRLDKKGRTDRILADVKRSPEENQITALKRNLPISEPPSAQDQAAMNLPFNLDVVANLNEEDPKLASEQVMNMNFQNKYVKKPNAAGLKVSDEIKRKTRKGFFKNTYPKKEEIQSILSSVRRNFGLPPEHAQDLTRILKFAESKRSTAKMVFDKIKKLDQGGAGVGVGVGLVSMKSGIFGKSYPKKEEMIRILKSKIEEMKAPKPKEVQSSSAYASQWSESKGDWPSGPNSSSSSSNQPQEFEKDEGEWPDYKPEDFEVGPGRESFSSESGDLRMNLGDDDESPTATVGPEIEDDEEGNDSPPLAGGSGTYRRTRKTFPKPSGVKKSSIEREGIPYWLTKAGGNRKTSAPTRKMRRSQRRNQSGGGVTMPLGFYQDGAQMQGTYGSETGAGLGGMTSTMAREALVQTGGSTFGSQRRKQTRKAQQGGFSPSIMGSFAANGISLLPVASYMTYRMTHGPKSKKGPKRTRKSGPVKTGRRRQTRR
jgi:serine/threonine protein kinase